MVDAKASKAFVHAEHESSSLSSCNFIIWYEVLLLAFRAELHSCAYGTVPDSVAISTLYHPLHLSASPNQISKAGQRSPMIYKIYLYYL